jgi:hypothetical protein
MSFDLGQYCPKLREILEEFLRGFYPVLDKHQFYCKANATCSLLNIKQKPKVKTYYLFYNPEFFYTYGIWFVIKRVCFSNLQQKFIQIFEIFPVCTDMSKYRSYENLYKCIYIK